MIQLTGAGRMEMNIDPRAVGKAKSAALTDPGVRESKRLFRQRRADSNPHVTRKGERS
ncbi:hypothetical protein LMA00_14905 [Burkholderia ambifaria]|uniref:hypothetical protein n=1 Tax=Burkholderia ambifaria TaxID=152480 RepID=UPI00158C5731|nr:hypothetical protein [Burkholderia ambifaria]UEP47929.1 hypothetical protein LMA00_14905 [Burkholderia ambifaria]